MIEWTSLIPHDDKNAILIRTRDQETMCRHLMEASGSSMTTSKYWNFLCELTDDPGKLLKSTYETWFRMLKDEF
jgi:hypothetical protein